MSPQKNGLILLSRLGTRSARVNNAEKLSVSCFNRSFWGMNCMVVFVRHTGFVFPISNSLLPLAKRKKSGLILARPNSAVCSGKIASPKPVGVGQDPERRGVDVQVSVHVPPVIYHSFVKVEHEEKTALMPSTYICTARSQISSGTPAAVRLCLCSRLCSRLRIIAPVATNRFR